ncbi:MAG: hypothetical protein AAF497_21600 [Planctomycetota bacterium]
MTTKPLNRTFPKATAILLLLIVAYFVLGRVTRNMAITRLRDMGVSVKIKRVAGAFSPIPFPVCWIDVGETVLDDKQLEQFFIAVRQLNMSDCRVALGRTAVTQAQRSRLMKFASNVQGHTIPPASDDLAWIPVSESPDGPPSKGVSRAVFFYFRNDSTITVKIFGSGTKGNQLLATLAPDRTAQAIAISRDPWIVADENDTRLGYFVIQDHQNFKGQAASAVVPADASGRANN